MQNIIMCELQNIIMVWIAKYNNDVVGLNALRYFLLSRSDDCKKQIEQICGIDEMLYEQHANKQTNIVDFFSKC